MLFVVVLVAAAVAGFLLWKLMATQPSERPRNDASTGPVTAPDDNPEFLRELGERLRHEGEDPPSRR